MAHLQSVSSKELQGIGPTSRAWTWPGVGRAFGGARAESIGCGGARMRNLRVRVPFRVPGSVPRSVRRAWSSGGLTRMAMAPWIATSADICGGATAMRTRKPNSAGLVTDSSGQNIHAAGERARFSSDFEDRYIVPRDVEIRLGISASTRRRWTQRGLLRAYPLGPFYRPGRSFSPEGRRNGSRVRYSYLEVEALAQRIREGELGRPR